MPTKPKDEIPTSPKRRQAFDQKFISAKRLAERWGLSRSAVYHGNSDVSLLRRIPFGKKSVRFLLSQVEEVERQKLQLGNVSS
jgi:predicted DNA-binding transcriptional regulator AlpA